MPEQAGINMRNSYFQFKKFKIDQADCAMKVTTDASLFGAWVAHHASKSTSVIDIGGGTGLLSLMLAQKNDASIDIVEIEKVCFHQMQKNIEASAWNKRIHCINIDIRSFVTSNKYDIVISNPPFHQQQLKSEDKAINLARHGNELTLEVLFKQVSPLLSDKGIFYLLMPAYRDLETISIAENCNMILNKKTIVKQSVFHDPFRIMYAFSISNHGDAIVDEIIIKDNKDQYTEKFIDYLRDYYLYF